MRAVLENIHSSQSILFPGEEILPLTNYSHCQARDLNFVTLRSFWCGLKEDAVWLGKAALFRLQ